MFKHVTCALVLAVGTAVAVDVGVAAQQRSAAADRRQAFIRLKAATFAPTRGELPVMPSALMIAGYPAGQRGYYLVQFEGPILDSWKADAAAIGAELLEYVPDFAFKVRMTPGQANRVEQLSSVVWVGLFHPAYKLSRAVVPNGPRLYTIRIERGADATAAAAAIAATGAQLLQRNDPVVTVSADAAQLNAIARVLDVASVDDFLPRRKHNEYGGGVILGAGLANASGYDGSTQTIAIADTGLGNGTTDSQVDIPASRISAIFNWPGSVSGCFAAILNDGAIDVDSGHGTHTTTSAVGSGGPGGEGRGTAPAAHLVFQAVENWAVPSLWCQLIHGLSNAYYLVGLPQDIRPLFQQAYDAGARIHSNSWGAATAGAYTTDSTNADNFIWNHRDMTITVSAGNEGTDANADGVIDYGSVGSPASAKNVITVGASENDRPSQWNCDVGLTYTNCGAQGGQNTIFKYGATWPADYPANPIKDDPSAGNPNQMAAFSSRGPTDDGRIKPDLVAPGTWVLSGYSDAFQQQYDSSPNPQNGLFQYDGWGYPLNRFYKYMGGTSMSNPLVAGAAAVVRDYFEKTAEHTASAALVKAALVNSAVDLADENNDGLDDNAYPIPNNHEGWGRVDLAKATSANHRFIDDAAGLVTNSRSGYTVAIDTAGSPLKITLAWSDFPSTPSAAKNLVNDLDLTVTAPDGTTTYLGNVFVGGWSETGGGADRTNNLENVYVASAGAGTWVVEVRGFNVPNGPQPFALIVSGGLSGPLFALPQVTLAATTPLAAEAGPAAGTITVTRAGNTTAPLTVHYSVSGTATGGADYIALSGAVTIPAGAATATITVSPIDDALVESDETVVLTLLGDLRYSVGSPSAATVSITSDDKPADLVVSAVTVPSIAGAGAIITVTNTTANSGPGPSLASSTGFYLSTDTLLDAADVFVGSRSVPALNPGGSDTRSTDLQIPLGTSTGLYCVLAIADLDGANAEAQETNNKKVSAGMKVGPDLVVSVLTVPAMAAAGGAIVVGDTTKNQGGGDAVGSTTRFYLSTNLSYDGADVALGGRTVSPIAANGTNAGLATLIVPASTLAGPYYILAKADGDATVIETAEINNVKFSSSVKVGADLVMSSLTVPTIAGAGELIVVTDTTKNQGAGATPDSTTAFYLSLNRSLDASDVALGNRHVPPLGSGETNAVSTTLTIPNGTPTAIYYIVANADGNGAIGETTETNNIIVSSSVKIGPDLTVTATSGPATAVVGTSITLGDTTKNQGGGGTTNSTTSFYLSTNLSVDASDTLLGTRTVGPLGPGFTNSASTAVAIPTGTPAGMYWILAAADADNAIVETVETNNAGVRSIRINAAP